MIKKIRNRGDAIEISPLSTQNNIQYKDRRSINLSSLNKLSNQSKNRSVIVIGRLGASDVSSSYII
jgi:hypothetical protein